MNIRNAALVLFGMALAIAPAAACNVPVFRYALEHWPADRYSVTVMHRGPLPESEQELVALLEQTSNCEVRRLEPGTEPRELPWMTVSLPAGRGGEELWAGRLTVPALRAILESPARQEIGRRLQAGESAVWVLVDNAEGDRQTATFIADQLQRLERSLRLPERTAAPEDRLYGEDKVPLRLAFSLLRVARDDPAEQLLVRSLLASEPDLAGRRGPMLFPVFGRGHILYALVGAGINAANIDRAATFLVSGCSCTIKEDNPGLDLLLKADWSPFPAVGDVALAGGSVPLPDPPVRSGTSPVPAVETVPLLPRPLVWGGVAMAALLVLATGRQALRRGKP
jgi:hypothetical protein